MKRGRPAIRNLMHDTILNVLSENQVPLTVSNLAKFASEKTGRVLSWNTAQKYVQELVEVNKVQPITLPHSKEAGKEGLTVYTLKK
jgi:hypothetical protein